MNETTDLQRGAQAEKPMEFIPYGSSDSIKLSVAIIQNLIAVPTKTGKTCSSKEALRFMMLCKAKRLNPFEGDCYLIGYDSRDGVATFSLITAHQAYLKRAEIHPEFDGMKSGLIILRNEQMQDIEGDFHLKDDELLGGWATVFFKTRKIPMTRRVRMARFRKPFGVWNDDPAGMIVKCAEADALRSSFPTMLGGLYLREEVEMPMSGKAATELGILPPPTNESIPFSGSHGGAPQAAERTEAPAASDELDMSPPPAKAKPESPQVQLQDVVIESGRTFAQFHTWANETGQFSDLEPENINSFADLPEALAKRLLRAKGPMLTALNERAAKEAK